MNYLILLLFAAAAVTYSAYSFVGRLRLKKENEELRDRYRLLRDSMEKEESSHRARYRISHENGKIDAIRGRLQDKYGNRILSERKLLEEIILYEKERADLLEVNFKSEVSRDAEDILLLFSEDESITFFLNMLGNALEAAAASGLEQKMVTFQAGKTFRLTNSKEEKNAPNETTSKEDAEKHGFGLGVIEDMCREKKLDLTYQDLGRELITEIRMA